MIHWDNELKSKKSNYKARFDLLEKKFCEIQDEFSIIRFNFQSIYDYKKGFYVLLGMFFALIGLLIWMVIK